MSYDIVNFFSELNPFCSIESTTERKKDVKLSCHIIYLVFRDIFFILEHRFGDKNNNY